MSFSVVALDTVVFNARNGAGIGYGGKADLEIDRREFFEVVETQLAKGETRRNHGRSCTGKSARNPKPEAAVDGYSPCTSLALPASLPKSGAIGFEREGLQEVVLASRDPQFPDKLSILQDESSMGSCGAIQRARASVRICDLYATDDGLVVAVAGPDLDFLGMECR